jgi:hypothetical protein
MKNCTTIGAGILFLIGFFFACLLSVNGQTDTSAASIEFLKAEGGYLFFKARLNAAKKEKTTLFVRDQEGELVHEDKMVGSSFEKVYKIPSSCADELVFEWVKPQRILLKKFKVIRNEISYVTVTRMH